MDMKEIKISGMDSNAILDVYDRTKEFIAYLDNEIESYDEEKTTEKEDK